jgi:hypothetical protein
MVPHSQECASSYLLLRQGYICIYISLPYFLQTGQVLPELPQPSHTFPQVDKLEIKLPHSNSITPVVTEKGLLQEILSLLRMQYQTSLSLIGTGEL